MSDEHDDTGNGGGGNGGNSEQMVPKKRFDSKLAENRDLAAKVAELEGKLRSAGGAALANEEFVERVREADKRVADAERKLAEREEYWQRQVVLLDVIPGSGDDADDARAMMMAKYERLGDKAPDFAEFAAAQKDNPPKWAQPFMRTETPAETPSEPGGATGEPVAPTVEDISDGGQKRQQPGNEGTIPPTTDTTHSDYSPESIARMSDNPEEWEKNKARIMDDFTSF